MKILIAEDDAIVSQLLQSTLKHMGHEVVVTRRPDRGRFGCTSATIKGLQAPLTMSRGCRRKWFTS
jgi:DNA-binding response OmpR family regulator